MESKYNSHRFVLTSSPTIVARWLRATAISMTISIERNTAECLLYYLMINAQVVPYLQTYQALVHFPILFDIVSITI